MAAQSVLGVSEMRPSLLDYVPHPARRDTSASRGSSNGSAGSSAAAQAPHAIILRRFIMNAMPGTDDEDDEVLEDEEFDEDEESDEDDEDLEDEDGEEEEPWQVSVLTS